MRKKEIEEEELFPKAVEHKFFRCPSCPATMLIEVERLRVTGSKCRHCEAKMVEAQIPR